MQTSPQAVWWFPLCWVQCAASGLSRRPYRPDTVPEAAHKLAQPRGARSEIGDNSADQVPPFGKGGKPAYAAFVVDCKGHRYVAFMERYSEKSTLAIDRAMAQGKSLAASTESPSIVVREYKGPGDAAWVSGDDREAVARIRVPKCPDGATGEVILP